MTSTGGTAQDMGQSETAQNGGAVKTEPRSPRLWMLIVAICAVFFSFRGAIELLPPRFRGNTFGLWVFLGILLAPFAGVIVLRRLLRASEHAASAHPLGAFSR